MPHPNMGNWRSKIAGKPVEYTRATSVQDLVSRRPAGAKLFEDLNVDLPEIGKSHDVVLRGTGLEYLESVLPREIWNRLQPLLDDRQEKPAAARPREEVLEALMRSTQSIELNLEEIRKRSNDA